jgi:hypothetical protein
MPPISQRSTQLSIGAIVFSTLSLLTNPNGAEAVTITYEAPDVIVANTSVIGSTVVNTFETGTVSITPAAYTFDFQDATTTNDYRATYDKLVVANYGKGTQTAGAGYTGKFAVNSNRTDLTDPILPTTNLTFTDTTNGGTRAGVKYFGMFFSSLDSGNQLTFYNGSTELAKLSISNFGTLVGGDEAPFTGGPYDQPGAFFNFYADANEEFTRIEFTQADNGGGFENDNHTFRIPNAEGISGSGVDLAGLTFTGNVTSTPIPEPFTIIGSIIGGTAAVGMRKKLKSTREE